ncbi:MAG: EpsG family protein [Akkermansia sp.]|nr:EpsG family protein [Akkermansia sp.]
MIIYISMILWVILMRVLCSGEMKYSTLPSGGRSYKVRPAVAYITVAYIIFWVGIRSGVADTRAYIVGFEGNQQSLADIPSILLSNGKGYGWTTLLVLFKNCISTDYHAWLMALALFMGLSVAHCYQKHSEAYFFCILIFILNGNQSWMMNGMRQFFCVCALMLALPWLIKGKTWYYLTLLIVLSSIHFTVLLMVPLYFILRQEPWSKLIWLSVAAIVCACYLADSVAVFAEDSLQSTSYAGSTVFNPDEADDGVHPLRVLVAAVPACLAWVKRTAISAEQNTLLNICINASLFSAMLYLFGVFTSGILMGRLPIYCEVFATLGLPTILNHFRKKNIRQALYISSIAGYAAFFILQGCGGYYVSEFTGVLH